MIEKIFEWVAIISKWVSGTMIGIMVLLNFYGVIMRYMFKNPLMWGEEVSLLLFVWAISLALVAMTYYRRAVKLDFFIDLMPPKAQKIIAIIVNIICSACLAIAAVLGISLMQRSQYRFTAILRVPFAYIYLAMVIGMFISAAICFYYAARELRTFASSKGESSQ